MFGGLARAIFAAGAAAALVGCAEAPPAQPEPSARSAEELRLNFVDVLAPGAFDWTGPAIVETDGAEGLWVVLPGAKRAERVRVRRLDGEAAGATADVALFRGPAGPGGAARLSAAAGEALGLSGTGQVRVTALRREPRLAGKAAPAPAAGATAANPADLLRRLF